MKNKFKSLAAVLQRQIITRGILGTLFLILFVILICVTKDFILSFPCIVLSAYLLINAGMVLYNCLTDKVITVTGTCVEIEHSKIFKRVKAVYIQTEDKEIRVTVRKKLRRLTIGVTMNLYLPEKAQIYERDGRFATGSYYAVEIK